jgi:hypothetical protein
MSKDKKFRIHVKLVQEVTFELYGDAYGPKEGVEVTAEDVMRMEEENVRSDPTYFMTWEDSTEHVEVDVQEVKGDA